MTQARRVRLVLRRIDPWTVLKFSLVLYASLYLVLLVAAVTLWAAASVTGLRGSVESFVGDLVASKNFRFKGGELFRASLIGGTLTVLLGSGVTVLFSVLHNLISDLIGGFGLVFEERPMRGAAAAGGKAAAAVPPPRSSWREEDADDDDVIEPRPAKPKSKSKSKSRAVPAEDRTQANPGRRHPTVGEGGQRPGARPRPSPAGAPPRPPGTRVADRRRGLRRATPPARSAQPGAASPSRRHRSTSADVTPPRPPPAATQPPEPMSVSPTPSPPPTNDLNRCSPARVASAHPATGTHPASRPPGPTPAASTGPPPTPPAEPRRPGGRRPGPEHSAGSPRSPVCAHTPRDRRGSGRHQADAGSAPGRRSP